MSRTSKELEEFKEEIRSVLISAKDGVPLHKIGADYYKFLAKSLPFRQLGFSNEMELLRAVPDAVRFVNGGGGTYLHAVCNEKTASIVELVSSQKRKTTGHASTKRNIGNHNVPPRFQRSNICKTQVPSGIKANLEELLYQFPDGLNVQNLKYAYRTLFGTDLNHQNYNFIDLTEFLRSLHNENVLKLREYSDSSFIFSVKHFNKSIDLSGLKDKNASKDSHFENENENTSISQRILENLRKVVEHFPEGFAMTDLCKEYKNVTGCVLDPVGLSYNNVQELVSDLEDVFRVEINETGEWILLDARFPPDQHDQSKKLTSGEYQGQEDIPECIQQNILQLLKHFPDGINVRELDELYKMNFQTKIGWTELNFKSIESMLVSLEFNPPIRFVHSELDVLIMLAPNDTIFKPGSNSLISAEYQSIIPEDAVVLGQAYTILEVPYVENDYISVLMSSVDSPGKFWMQLVSETEQRNIDLENLMNDLGDFYQSPAAEKYRVPEKYLMKNLNCAVLYPEDNNWHRGCIIGKPGPTAFEIFYYDYGTVFVVQKDLLRLLKKSFSVLPAQAFSARMARIQPLSTFYSPESSARLLELSSGKPLMAQITSKTFMNTYSVILCDTNGEEDIFLNDILITEGLVKISNDRVLEVRNPVKNGPYNHFPESSSGMPSSVIYSNSAGLSLSNNFHNPYVSPIISSFEVPSVQGANLPCTLTATKAQNYNLSSLDDLHQPNNNILDADVVRCLEERELARRNINFNLKERSCAPQAEVGPIQISKATVLEPNLAISFTDENYADAYQSDEEETIRNLRNSDHQKEIGVCVNSNESNTQESGSSSSVNTGSNACPSQLRYCKKVTFREDQYSAHLINFARQPFFNSGDVSSFVFGVDIIKRMLQIQKYPPCHIIVSREDEPALFADLEKFEVTGFTEEDVKTNKVILYALSDVIKILGFLNHSKETLCEDIAELLQNFDPIESFWITNENSVEGDSPEETLHRSLHNLKEERKSLLLAMLAEDCSNVEITNRLLQMHKDIIELKMEIKSHSKIKSATEQARDFLERVKITFESEKSSEYCTSAENIPEHNIAVTESSKSEPSTTTSVQTACILTTTISSATSSTTTVSNHSNDKTPDPSQVYMNPVAPNSKFPSTTMNIQPAGVLTSVNSSTVANHSNDKTPDPSQVYMNPVAPNSKFPSASMNIQPAGELTSVNSSTVYSSTAFVNHNNSYLAMNQTPIPSQGYVNTATGSPKSQPNTSMNVQTASVLAAANLSTAYGSTVLMNKIKSYLETTQTPVQTLPSSAVPVPMSANVNTAYGSGALSNYNSNVLPVGQLPIPPQGYMNPMIGFQSAPRLPATVPAFYQNNFAYQPKNHQYMTPGVNNFRYMSTPHNYNQWQP